MLETVDRSREFWTPPRDLLHGQTAFLLGGGPSLRALDIERLRGRQVVAINSACHLAPWAPILFFTDNNWFDDHRAIIEPWSGLVVTVSRHAKGKLPDKLLRIELAEMRTFTVGHQILKRGRSSGHTAISLVIALGCRDVVLLGYDMRVVDGRSHHHDDYHNPDVNLYATDFLPAFKGWNKAAREAGVTVRNATPDSALDEFERASIDDILREAA